MKRNALEWAILAVSVVAIVGIVGFLLVEAVADGGRPAAVGATAEMERGVAAEDGWLVPIRVYNRGGTAALSVTVEVTGTVEGTEEVSELTVDVLAGGSEVELLAGFSARPEADVAIRIVGLETP
jgi:uncharacterized protein (TIGR02588 family)